MKKASFSTIKANTQKATVAGKQYGTVGWINKGVKGNPQEDLEGWKTGRKRKEERNNGREQK